MKRQAITPAMKIDCLLYRGAIRCAECGDFIHPGNIIEWDHIHALVHGGEHKWLNLCPLHYHCHKGKTARDIAANAKVKRIAKGGRKRKGRPLSGTKASGMRKRMNGQVEKR